MPDLFSNYVILCIGAFVAGLVDAVVGGGGLVLIPTLFSVFPNVAPATLLGTNKVAGVMGTSAAAINFARKVRIHWAAAAPAALAAFALSFSGAYLVTHVPTDMMRKALPFILLAVAIYTLKKKDFGQHHTPLLSGGKERLYAILVGAGVGFYDGLFGPGTGSFFVFLFVRIFGYDFLRASAVSKVVNIATNLAALVWFFVQRPRDLATGFADGRLQYRGLFGWYTPGDEARQQLCPQTFPVRGERTDFEDWLRCVFKMTIA